MSHDHLVHCLFWVNVSNFQFGLTAVYSLLFLKPGTSSVAVVHLVHGLFMCTASFLHANNNGLLPMVSASAWPLDANLDGNTQAILLPWAVLCGAIGAVCMLAFLLTAGTTGKAKAE